jgi:hypothetical protein
MTDLFLRTTTEQDLRNACPFLLDEDGDWHHDTLQFSVSVIGSIPPELDENEEVVKPGDDGFHVNVRLVDLSLLDQFPAEILIAPEPETPIRVWA